MKRIDQLTIGVLALQGDYSLHQRQLGSLGVAHRQVKLPADLTGLDGLIMPGGESTTMNILMDRFALRQPLVDFARHKPIYGTCAGMILLSKKIEDNQSGVRTLGLIDIDVVRNGYGRQVFSFEDRLEVALDKPGVPIEVAFIRAPRVTRIGKQVKSLAVYRDSPVLVSQGRVLAASFHAELGGESTLLRYFLERFCCPAADI